jgi:hypothetical protein
MGPRNRTAVDDELAVLADEAPACAEAHRGEPLVEAAGVVELRIDDGLPLLVDVAVLAAHLHQGEPLGERLR